MFVVVTTFLTKMGTGSDASICRINDNEIVVDGDLIVNGVSTSALMKTIEDMQKRLRALENLHK